MVLSPSMAHPIGVFGFEVFSRILQSYFEHKNVTNGIRRHFQYTAGFLINCIRHRFEIIVEKI